MRRLPRAAYEPLKIRAHLRCGVVCDPNLPIDGVLYYMRHREALGPQQATIPGGMVGGEPRSAGALPLARVDEHGPDWYYAASFAQWPEPVAVGRDYWVSHLDTDLAHLIDFRGRAERVDIRSGRYRAYRMPIAYRHALYVDWYVLGLRTEIARLLGFCSYLGKKTSQGWGEVAAWAVEPHPHDWSVCGPRGLMRAVPAESGMLYGIRPSYWLPANQRPCRMPG